MYFEEFIKQAYAKFIEIEPKDLVRQAIQYVVSVNSTEKTLENSFLSLYSALESLLLHFRRVQKLETVFDLSDEWSDFQAGLKRWVKKFPPLTNDKGKRILIYEKLPELNRVSFSTAFKKLCEYFSLDLNDLWPVCNNSDGISLAEIRNNLIHGEYINLSHFRAIMSAKENLQWILERIILSILGWPISKSNVNEHFLGRNMACYKEWKEDRKILGKK